MTVLPLAYAVMHGLWRSATEKSGCANLVLIEKRVLTESRMKVNFLMPRCSLFSTRVKKD